ncbi:RHS repeat protein [Myxococcus sp. AS-1-15]|uniref:RHS repeat protein n=1 Tax=Myxococcus sp. AS-1-15 TaxID=2874600 RepID=UPI001CBFE140|nr:RHS repeat-associated core domain-containing protein [Myxococcus sp. AS-1-15]MBZ4398700.1 hypothetical protein [Myxococcus sp. AS-1-15]
MPKIEAPGFHGDPVNVSDGYSYLREQDFELKLSQGSLPFIRMYVSPARSYAYSRFSEGFLPSTSNNYLARPFGEHRNGGSLNWWHNFYSAVYKWSASGAEAEIRDVDGFRNTYQLSSKAAVSGRWYVNDNNKNAADRLWQDVATVGTWPQKFVYYREESGRYEHEAVYVHPDGTGARHYFLTRIFDTEYAPTGATEIPRAVVTYAVPVTSGGTTPDTLCPVGGAGSTPGVPYINTVTTRDGTVLRFYYQRLVNTRGRTECVLDHINVESQEDGGATEKTLVQYQYKPASNFLVKVDYPQTGRSIEYTYPVSGNATTTFERKEGGALTSRHSYYYNGTVATRDEGEGHDFTINDVTSSNPGVADACTLVHGGTRPTREFVDSKAGLGTGANGATTMTSRFVSAPAHYQHQTWRLNSMEERCDGTSCPGFVGGIQKWEYECPLAPGDTSTIPAMPKAHKDRRNAWELYTHAAVPDAGMIEGDAGVPIQHMKSLTRLVEGAQDSSGTGALAQTDLKYTLGSTGRAAPAYERLLERLEVPSVLAPGGGVAQTQFVYDTATNRLKAEFRTGWTQVWNNTAGAWQVVKKRVGLFHYGAPQCGGVGTADAQGRELETHGPCFVDETADVATITGCPVGTVFPVVKYEYWATTETGHKRNQLKKKSVLPGGCGGATSLETQYLDYDVYGNATRVQDFNGVVVERQYNQSQLTRQSVVAGSVTTTTQVSYDNGRLKAIQHPQGNYDVFCYRTGTTTGMGCVGGTPTYLLQWRAKGADANGASWTEKVEYAYWPDETVKTETYLSWTGSAAETRRVVTFAADARRNPTYQGLGNLPSPVAATRLFDANGNLTGVGFASNAAPAVCGGPDSAGQPVSTLCASLGYDRLDRLAKLDEFPSTGVSQRTCFSYDVQSNVTAVRQGCAVGTGNECGSCTAESPASEYAHDDFGNLVWAKLPHTQDGVGGAGTTRYAYNALGLLVEKASPEMQAHGERVSQEYDAVGRLLRRKRHFISSSSTPAVQNLFVLSYDVTDTGDATSTPPVDCPQPANTGGRLRYQHDSFGRTWYQYDAHGRLAGEVRLREGQTGCASAGLNDKPHTFYTYTANGNVDVVTYPHGRVVKYVYGTGAAADRVQAVDVRLWGSSGFTDTRLIQGVVWEPYGQLRGYQVNHPTTSNSSAVEYMLGGSAGEVPTACPASAPSVSGGDLTGRLRALRVSTGTLTPGAGSGDIYKRTYTWSGDQVSQVDTCVLGATTPRVETYGYDRSLRLVTAGRPTGNVAATGGAYTSRSYGYDSRGNRTSMSADGTAYAYTMASAPAVDRLAEWGKTASGSLLRYALAHDADGRVTSQRWAPGVSGTPVYVQGFEYGVDEGAQTGVATDTVFRAVNRNGLIYNYFYDAQGRRRLKAYPGGTKDEYFNSYGHKLLTDRGSDGFATAVGHYTTDDYVWLGGKSVAVIRAKFSSAWARQADGVGSCTRNEEAVACGVYFPVVDHLDKPVVMLDASRRVAGAADYDPFGHVNRVSQVAETAHPYTSGSSVSLGTLTQPVSAGVEVVRMRALYHLVDTQSGAASVSLVDVDTTASLHSTSEVRKGNVVTPWVQPANGRVEVRFAASGAAASGYQGVVLEGYEYQRYQSGAQPFWIPLRFPGQYHDDETGFAENWNRFYNPSIGGYLQAEPVLQNPDVVAMYAQRGESLPTYAYAQNNSINKVDLNGRNPLVIPVGIGLALGEAAVATGLIAGGVYCIGTQCLGDLHWPWDDPPVPDAPPNNPSTPPNVCEMGKGGKGRVTTTPIREEIGILPKGTDLCKYLKEREKEARRARNSSLAREYHAAWKEYCRGHRG